MFLCVNSSGTYYNVLPSQAMLSQQQFTHATVTLIKVRTLRRCILRLPPSMQKLTILIHALLRRFCPTSKSTLVRSQICILEIKSNKTYIAFYVQIYLAHMYTATQYTFQRSLGSFIYAVNRMFCQENQFTFT